MFQRKQWNNRWQSVIPLRWWGTGTIEGIQIVKFPVLSLFPNKSRIVNDTQFKNLNPEFSPPNLQSWTQFLNTTHAITAALIWMNLEPLNPNGTPTWKNWWPNKRTCYRPSTCEVHVPQESWPSDLSTLSIVLRTLTPCYTGSNPSIGGSDDN